MSVLCILIVPFQVKNGLVILCLCYVYYYAFPGLERFGHSMSVLCILMPF